MTPARQSLLGNLAFSTTLFLALLGGVEGVARWLEARRPRPAVAAYLWNWDRMWQGDFYTLGGGSPGWPPGREINADGVRDAPHTVEKPARTFRLVFLGDSVTMGHGIATAEAYPQVLQRRLDRAGWRVEVFNVALQGWSTRQERLAFERLARRYRPDLVVLAVCLNDVPELQNNLSSPPPWLARLYRRSAAVRRLVDAEGREIGSVEELFAEPEARHVQQGWLRFFDEVRGLRDQVLADGARLAVLVFPFRFQVLPGAPAPLAQRRLAAFAHQERLPLLDVLPALEPMGAAAFFDYDHLSPAGAKEVAAQLLATGWIPSGYERRPLLGGEASPEALLASADPAVREASAWQLCSHGGAPVAALVRLLERDPDRAVRAAAARALGCGGTSAGPGPSASLLEALRDESEVVRWAAARALARLRPQRELAQPALEAALASPDPFVCSYAAFELGRFGPRARSALPALLEALGRQPRAEWLARSLARLDPSGERAVPPLVDLLGERETSRRVNAALALGCLGGAAGAALPDLLTALRDPDPALRAEAARALGRVGRAEPAVLDALAEALQDKEVSVRVPAARALGWLGPAAAASADALRRATADESYKVAGEATRALERQSGAPIEGLTCQ